MTRKRDLRYTMVSIRTNGGLALVAALSAAEELVSAFRAEIPFSLVGHPLFCPDLPPVWYRPQDDFFRHGDGELIDQPAGKIGAFMTPRVTLLMCACPDGTLLAVVE